MDDALIKFVNRSCEKFALVISQKFDQFCHSYWALEEYLG
jgi:hypothetical protein